MITLEFRPVITTFEFVNEELEVMLEVSTGGGTTIEIASVGWQGAEGPPGPAGLNGAAEIPDVLDGGNF